MSKKITFMLRNAVCLVIASSFILPLSAYAQEHALGRILVKSKANVPQAKLKALLNNNSASIISTIDDINVHIIKVPKHAEETVAHALARSPNIEFAELDLAHELTETIPDDDYYGNAWHLPKIGAPAAWDMSKGTNVTVAVLDSGVDPNHPDLKDKLLPGFNTVDNSTNTADIAGHGTKVAGVIGAASNNGIGVASIAWNASLLPVRVSNESSGTAWTSDIAEGVTWAANNGAKVVNASYAVTFRSTVSSAASYLKSKGGLLVVSAGNDGSEVTSAGDNPNIISVAATASNDSKTSWSTYGNFVDVTAPGSSIWTTVNGGNYGSASGTSFSSPLTAGVIALMMSANPNLTPDELETILESTAVDLGSTGFDKYNGHGRVDAHKAVLAAMNTSGSGGGSGGSIDTTAPSVSISSPGSIVSGLVTVSASASDETQLQELVIYAGSKVLGTTSNGSLSVNWDTTAHNDGSVILKAVATDSSNNSSSKSVSVTVANNIANDITPPNLSIQGISDGQTISKNTSVSVIASDNVALSLVNCKINGSLVASSNTSLTCNINVKKLKSGSHNLTANAVDMAGNSTSKSVNFTIGSGSTSGGGSKGKGKGRKK